MRRRSIPLILLLGSLGFIALEMPPARAADPSDDASHTLRIGDELPTVDFRLADGTRLSRESLLGRYVLLDFWATWCAPCIASFPELNRLQREFADRPIDIYSVTYESPAKIEPVLNDHPLETLIGFDNDFATFKAFRAWGIPATYVFNPDGKLVSAIHPEHLDADLLETILSGRIPNVEQTRGWPDPEGAEEHFRSLVD